MNGGLHAAWERISSLGVHDDPPGEVRRIRLTNQSAIIGTASCGAFAIGYAVAGPRYAAPMIANVIAVAMLLGALALSRRGARTLARIAVLVPVNVVVVAASMILGGRVGFIYYFFLFAMVSFLLFSEEERRSKWMLAFFSAACLVFTRLAAPADDAVVIAVTRQVAEALDVVSALGVIATGLFIVHLFTRDTAQAEARLAEEHARSERLLLNILPAAISARLKDQGESIADGFADVTVVFADIVGFTELSQRLSPAELVSMLNRIFSAFDELAAELGVEKIKTIGDCYMAAAGLPDRRPDHAEIMARMALRMRESLAAVNQEAGYSLRIRMGLHSGAVVAGVIGKRKFIYDLWGDTVNTASRMESSGIPGEIQISRDLYERLGERFEMEPRGVIQVKGKGEMETFLLKGERGAPPV